MNEENKVKVTANDKGEVVNVSENNPKYGFIRVTQKRNMVDESGWLRTRNLSSLIPGLVEDLKQAGWVNGQYVKGKIYVKEQMVPFNKRNPEKDLKIAGETKVVCKVGDDPIYRKPCFSFNTETQDILVQHTNAEEIKAAYAHLVASGEIAGFEGEEEEGEFSL